MIRFDLILKKNKILVFNLEKGNYFNQISKKTWRNIIKDLISNNVFFFTPKTISDALKSSTYYNYILYDLTRKWRFQTKPFKSYSIKMNFGIIVNNLQI